MIETSRRIDIHVNGKEHSVPSNITLEDLLRLLNRNPKTPGIAVALNENVIPRSKWQETRTLGGDRIEIITASQGG